MFTLAILMATAALPSDCSSKPNLAPVVHVAAAQRAGDIVDTAVAAGDFSTLVAAVKAAGLVETLKSEGPFTVFAPTDAAFAALPKGTLDGLLKPEAKGTLTSILTYHVVAGRLDAAAVLGSRSLATVNGQRLDVSKRGDVARIDGAKIVKTDIVCSNGIIHVIDAVVMPSSDSIVATATAAGSFRTLLAAATAAGLAETLGKDGPFTVFAPTDAAFAALPKGTVEDLLKPENKDRLVAILKLHVVSGRVDAATAIGAGEAKTLQGSTLRITSKDGNVMVGGAKVSTADLDASNGIIHVIDQVLLPQA